ncbi:hypothetical protein UFOVP621_67 [uncultured Caudovirales phage]|uniref:Holin n=1 Tax=uncultured Caudovirales phage TaxID=2100421 RepID=A0A6J5N5H5_9CAUD|nr:hypothetical protein UFOVP621_67 [uncultured Caudovirales phage]
MSAKRKAKDITLRMVAVVIASVMGTIGGGSLLGVEAWKSAALAAVLGVAVVAEQLARNYINDGNLSEDEINSSFNSSSTTSSAHISNEESKPAKGK